MLSADSSIRLICEGLLPLSFRIRPSVGLSETERRDLAMEECRLSGHFPLSFDKIFHHPLLSS